MATPTFDVRGPIAPGDLPGLCERVRALLHHVDGGDVACDVTTVEADAVTVEALARLELAARRHGCHVRLVGPSRALIDLVELMGLSDVLAE